MSAQAAPHTRPDPTRSLRAVAVARVLGLGALLAIGAVGALPRECVAQADESQRPKSARDQTKADPGALDRVDTRRPVPADAPGRKTRERLAVPNSQGAAFGSIQDFQPLARQDQNAREFDAWTVAVLHTRGQSTDELNEYAARDLAPINLTQTPDLYRCDLVRFDGRLVCARRLAVTAGLLVRSGITELYEVRLVPLDESPRNPVSVVLHELPEELAAAVRGKAPNEWADATGWAAASGYFFKAMSVEAAAPGTTASIPLLIGKGLTPLDGPPAGSPTPAAFDRKLRIFKSVKDNIKASRPQPGSEGWFEYAAYNRAVLRAHRFSPEEMERDATADLRFADLFEYPEGHRMALVRFQGRLISLRRLEPNEWLAAGGVDQLFEGWMVPENEPRGNPICIVFTEPLPDVEPARRVNKWVTFAGYAFKLLRYESGEEDPKEKGRRLDKLAPMLIGKGPIGRRDPSGGVGLTWSGFVTTVLIAAVLIVGSAVAFTLWYRRGDRQTKAEMNAIRHRNPFDPAPAPVPVDPDRP